MSNKLIMTSLILIFCFSTFSSKSSAAEKPAKPRPKITISKETTFITKPLDADGYPDYVAALNQHCSRGVTPENNAAVLFWKAFGPAEIKPERREQYFKMLGMEPLPDKGKYFRTFLEQTGIHSRFPDKSDEITAESSLLGDLLDEFFTASNQPWSRDAYPVWAEWLTVNEQPMALLTEASKRLRFYSPRLADEHISNYIIDQGPHMVEIYRNNSYAFVMRSMLRTQEGKTTEAWNDLLTSHRLVRLVGKSPAIFVKATTAYNEEMTLASDRALINYAGLSSDRIAMMQKDFDALPPFFDFMSDSNRSERLFSLSIVVSIVRASPQERNEYKIELIELATSGGLLDEKESIIKPILGILGDAEIDWNLVLRTVNIFYDRLDQAYRKPLSADRRKALAEHDEYYKQLLLSANDVEALKKVPKEQLGNVASEHIAQALLVLMAGSHSMFSADMEKCSMTRELTRLAFALARYKADHGSYPAKLDDLKPKYIGAIPVDFFNNDAPLNYSRENEGYLLYSVGLNGDDDGGRDDYDEKTEVVYDDIVVRVPVTKK